MRPEPLRPVRYDAQNPAGSFAALETSLQRVTHSIDTALLSLEPTDVKTGTYTARPLDLVRVDPTSAAFEVLIPDPKPGGPWLMVKKVTSSTNAVTLRALSSTVTIDGAATQSLGAAYDQALLFPVSSTQWAIIGAKAQDLSDVLAVDGHTGGSDITIDSGDSIIFDGAGGIAANAGQMELQVWTEVGWSLEVFSEESMSLFADVDLTLGASNDVVINAADEVRIQYSGDDFVRIGPDPDHATAQSAFFVYSASWSGTPRISVTQPAGSGVAGKDIILQGGDASSAGNARGGHAYIRPGSAVGSGAAGNVFIQDFSGNNILGTDIDNARLRVYEHTTLFGTTTGGSSVLLQMVKSGASTVNALAYTGTYIQLGNTTVPNRYHAADTGAAFGVQGHAFYVDSNAIAELTSAGWALESGKTIDWASGTASITRAGTSWLSNDGTSLTVRGPSEVFIGAGAADTVRVGGTTLRFLATVNTPIIGQIDDTTAGVTCDTLLIQAQGSTATSGDNTGGAVHVSAGSATGSGTGNRTGADVILTPGDGSGGSGTNTDGVIRLRNAAGGTVLLARATEVELQSGVLLDWASGTASISVGGTTWLSSTTSLSSFAQAVSVTTSAATVATGGHIRGPASFTIRKRNTGDTADVDVISDDGSSGLIVGDETDGPVLGLRALTTINGRVAGSTIWITRSTEIEIQSTMGVDFAGELKITRAGTDYITSTSGVVNITTSAHLNIVKGQALGGGAAATLGTIGGSGPATAAQNKWVEIKSNGTTGWVPFWV